MKIGLNLQLSEPDRKRLSLIQERFELSSKTETLRQLIRATYVNLTARSEAGDVKSHRDE